MRLILFVLTTLAIAGCSGTAVAEDPSLEGRTFVSVAVDGEQIPGGGPLTLGFADGQVSAFAGCNHGAGAVDLGDGHLTVTQLATTMMGCPPPRDGADGWMSQFLAAGPAWTLGAQDGVDTLTLSTDTTTVTLRDQEVVQPDRPLVGTTWRVDTLLTEQAATTSVALEQARPTLTLHADQSVTGWTGCHTFYGRAEITGETVTFAPVNTDGPGCAGDVGDIEGFIVDVLDGPVAASVDADRLTLTGAKGHGLVLRAE